jgi:hypothetical protein
MNWDLLIELGYLGFVSLGFVFVLIARLKPTALVPLGTLLRFIFQHRITRIALFMVWWWLGWHFLVGVTVR